jgi:Catalase-related immune-responsive
MAAPAADPTRTDDGGTCYADGEMVRTAYTLRPEDDDWGQAGTLVRDVLDDAARLRLVDNIVGHLLNGVSEPILQRAFAYWRNVDKNLGDRIEQGVRSKQDEKDPKAAEQANPARESMQPRPKGVFAGPEPPSRRRVVRSSPLCGFLLCGFLLCGVAAVGPRIRSSISRGAAGRCPVILISAMRHSMDPVAPQVVPRTEVVTD